MSKKRTEAEVWRSMLGRIRVHGASGLWTGEDCAIGAVAALEGGDAGRAFMLQREAARGAVSGTEPDTAKLVEAGNALADAIGDIAVDVSEDRLLVLVKQWRDALAGFSVDAGKPEEER